MPGSVGEDGRRKADIADQRCEKTASLYLRGHSYAEIAQQLQINRDTVRRDLKRARKHWRTRASRSYAKHLYQQLAKLDELERAAWEGWERSLRDEVSTTAEDGQNDGKPHNKTQTKRRPQSGNASMLKTVNDTIRQRSELLGLLDSDARSGSTAEADTQVVTIVIDSREEATEFKSLSLSDYKEKLAETG